MTRKYDSRQSRFQRIICRSQGLPDKHVPVPVATVDSKAILLGATGNWTCRWKLIEDLEIEADSLSWTFKGDHFICHEAEPQTWEAFQSRVSKYWNKRQTKDSLNNEAPSRPVSYKSTKRRRIAYGSRNRRSSGNSVYKQSEDPMWSSDEGEHPGSDDAKIEESVESLPTNETVLESDPQSPNQQESKVFSDESSVEDGPSRPQRLKRYKQKRATNVIRDADDADDSDTFPAEEMTIPATQRVVSPQETFETTVEEHDSREEKPSLKTIPISDFFRKRTVRKTETLETPTTKIISSSEREVKSPVPTKPSLSEKSKTSRKPHEDFFKPRKETSRDEGQNTMPSTPTRSPQPTQRKTPEPPLQKSSTKKSSLKREEAASSLPLRQRRLSLRARRLDLSSEALKDVGQGLSSTKTSSGHKGLYNLGNTCYINASLQLLFSVPNFIAALAGKGKKLAERTVSLAHDLSQDSTKAFVDAKSLKIEMDKRTDKFLGYEQRDAHEFLGDLLDNVHEELIEVQPDDLDSGKTEKPDNDTETTNKHKPNGPQDANKVDASEIPITDDFFRLDMMVCLTCQSCGYSRSKKEMYRHLSLDIDYDGDNMTRSVENSLEKFFQPEDREVNCEKCDEGDRARQTLTIVSRPKALLLHLKRFVFVESSTNGVGGVSLQKNKSSVEIAEVLSLEKFMRKPDDDGSSTSIVQQPYSLRGIVHHIGNQATSGHYTADAVRPPIRTDSTPTSSTKPTWVTFDDARTVETSLKDIVSSDTPQKTAYMLMYANG